MLIKRLFKPKGRIHTLAVTQQSSFFWAGCNAQFNEAYLTFAFTVGINTSSLAFSSAAVAFNDCFAVLVALALVFSPIALGYRLRKGWRKPVALPEASQ